MISEQPYLYLMLALAAAVVVITAASPQSLPGIFGVSTAVFSLMLVSAYILAQRKAQMRIAILLGAAAFLPFIWINIVPESLEPPVSNTIYALNLGVWLLFTAYIGRTVFRSLMNTRSVTANHICGAIYLYLLIGIMFGLLFQMLLVWQPDALFFDPARFARAEAMNSRLYARGAGDVLYYSFVTLGTVGYGDVTPASPIARSLSLIEAVVGIMYVATMIARFVSLNTSGRARVVETRDSD